MRPSQIRALRSLTTGRGHICRQCRQFSIQRGLHQEPSPSIPQAQPNLPPVNRPAPDRQLAPNRIRKDFIPEPIGAPIGFKNPPDPDHDWFKLEKAGDTYLQRNAANRKVLAKKYEKSYFRDFRNMDANNGKFYLANEKLYRRDVALYFPNLNGRNLSRTATSTTRVAEGKVTVVAVYSRQWAYNQAMSFIGQEENPQLADLLAENKDLQVIEINHEEFRLSSIMLWMFEWNLKRARTKKQQDRYFIMRGIPEMVKGNIGIMNDKLGYTFLLDKEGRIRWSACGDALDAEKASLVTGAQKLLSEGIPKS